MKYKKFIFDKKSVHDIQTDTIIFPFSPGYLKFQDWSVNNPTEFHQLTRVENEASKWQGLVEEIIPVRNGIYNRKLYYKDYTLWVESEVKKLPNQDFHAHGIQTTYYKSSNTKSIEYFRNGDKHGEFTEYLDSEEKSIISRGKYNLDKKAGEWIYYTGNNINTLEKYLNGVLIKLEEYNNTKEIIKEYNYNAVGEMDGLFKDTHHTGQLRARGYLKNGLMDGIWRYYNRDGSPHYEINFKLGNPIGRLKYFSMTGDVIVEMGDNEE